jgi:DNA-binding response OmpR family regulator
MKDHLLVVEDELMVQGLLALHLKNEGYAVSVADSGNEMLAILEKEVIDLVLLDLNLPDEDGLVLARRLRARSAIPIIVLSARKSSDDRLSAFEIGVDDYLVKPYDPQELLLKIPNLLNRSKRGSNFASSDDGVMRFGGWTLDIPGRSLTGPDGREMHLTPGEFNLLFALAQSPDRVLSRDQLLDATSKDGEPTDRAIDIIVTRLRKKIEKDPKKPRLIITITGFGYKLTGKVEKEG